MHEDAMKKALSELARATWDYLHGAMTPNLKPGDVSPKYIRLRDALDVAQELLRN